ncbi:MAG: hypothetical protein AAAB16_14625 [Pseudomonas sp.]|uniref:DUF7693 family protein n=1 Tax=Pseudomonas sp. TaxID=306 RepID=UPI0030F28FC6
MPNTALSAREVYQLLKDIALGVRLARRAADKRRCGGISILVDGWRLTLFKEDGQLDHCAECVAPDGRVSSIDSWHRHGTDPIQLLSRWEREELERLLL